MSNLIAHELRNSLNVISGFARRLAVNSKDASLNEEHLKAIVDEANILDGKVIKNIKTREKKSSN